MSEVKVWIGGEGSSEIGDLDKPGGKRRGAIEALLLRVEAHGWKAEGAIQWKAIRHYQAGAAKGKVGHEDERNVIKLVQIAKDAGCEVVAFTRDIDADPDREGGIEKGIDRAAKMSESIIIIGGAARPALEGWILALLRQRDTDRLSRKRANEMLDEREVGGKQAEDYVEVIENADLEHLPPGCESLKSWLGRAKAGLSKASRG